MVHLEKIIIDAINSRRIWVTQLILLEHEAQIQWGDKWHLNDKFKESSCSKNMEWCYYEINHYEHQFQKSLCLN